MRRVMIVGNSGSGKSTLARRLAEKTGLPLIHIDRLYFDDQWRLRPLAERRELVAEAAANPAWIFDGNNPSSYDLRIERADTLIFLDRPVWLSLLRVVKRVFVNRGGIQPDMPQGFPEQLDFGFMKSIAGFTTGGRKKVLELMAMAPQDVVVHHLKSSRDVETFLASITPQADDRG